MPNKMFVDQDHMIKGKTAVNNKALFIRNVLNIKYCATYKVEARGIMVGDRLCFY